MVWFINLFYKYYNICVCWYIKLYEFICKIVFCILKFNFVLRYWFKYIWFIVRIDGIFVVVKYNIWFGIVWYRIRIIWLVFVGYICKIYFNEKNCKLKILIDWNKDFLI